MKEGQSLEKKSLRLFDSDKGFRELAKDCVCLANGAGGAIHIGIEDDASEPPPGQRVPPELVDRIRKRIRELTVNVQVVAEVQTSVNGGEAIRLNIPRAAAVASTSDGRYFIRIGEDCRPIVGDDIMRLANERAAAPWEQMATLRVPRAQADPDKVGGLVSRLRDSDRVAQSVREKSDDELLEHYGLLERGLLTNLGVLLVGTASDRARLGTAPVVQAMKYDDRGEKVAKFVWDDYTLSPIELVDRVWEQVPDFRESYEMPDGMLRTTVAAFDEVVVRELMVNALVHRPYTQRGDIFLNLHPDRLEVVNPGRLPLGVTPQNILHTSRRRNDGLARVFHDVKLMEREGSGFDLMYDRLLTSGRGAPQAREGTDSVHVTVPRRVLHPAVIRLVADVNARFQLTQRERIVLALLAQSEGLRAVELAARLELDDVATIHAWIGRLVDFGMVGQTGRTRATRYFVHPDLIRSVGLDRKTTLARIQPHRLKALVLEDLERFPGSSAGEIHRRTAPELHPKTISRILQKMFAESLIAGTGKGRWRRYGPKAP